MLKSALFSVIFKVDNVEMREEYQLVFSTANVCTPKVLRNTTNSQSTEQAKKIGTMWEIRL